MALLHSTNTSPKITRKSSYAKVHDYRVDAQQRKEAEKSACGKAHDPAFKLTEIYFQEKLLCNFWVKNGNYSAFTFVNVLFRRIFLE